MFHFYEATQRFAAKFYEEEKGECPKGWPSETYPLDDGASPRDGFTEHTGQELNQLRVDLLPRKVELLAEMRREAERQAAITETDRLTRDALGAGFEWPLGSGQRFSLSLPAQTNLQHASHSPVDEFPMSFSTLEHLSVEVSHEEFADFYATARARLREILGAGRAAKTTTNEPGQ